MDQNNNLFLYRKILYVGHLAGLYHLPQIYQVSHSPWQRSLHLYYYRGVHTFFILVALSNAASTFLFSTKNLSEFLQRLLDCTFIAGIYSDVLCTTFYVDKFLLLLDDVQKSLSRKTLAKYARGRKQFVPILLVIGSTCILLTVAFTDSYFVPLSLEEQEQLKQMYNRKYGVRFSLNFYIPGVDLSEPWLYHVTQLVIFYLAILMLINVNIVICEVPLFVMNMEAHYDSLCSAIELIGQVHMDKYSRLIEYTDVSLDEYVVLPIKLYHGLRGEDPHEIHNKKLRYEKSYIKQIIMYHRKILDLTEQHHHLIVPSSIVKSIYPLTILATSAYQLFAPKQVYSKMAFIRYVVEFINSLLSYYIFCHYSERLNSCHARVRHAIVKSDWINTSKDTQRSLMVIVIRTYSLSFIRALGGIVTVNFQYLLGCMKFSYSLLNFFTIKEKSKQKIKG